MAQLPPKVPGIGSDRAPQSWADDFLKFSASKRRCHRRSVSDSVAFVEEHDGGGLEFHRIDDEHLFSMFIDDSAGSMHLSPEKQSTPSDNYSINEKAMEQQEEAESDCKGDALVATPDSDTISDPKRVKRIIANRQSAQRSRVRKLHYISELERSVTSLQVEVSTLSPRVAFLDHQRSLLTLGNSQLKQRIAALAQDNIFKDAHQEALKEEVERLRKIYHEQSLQTNMESQSSEDPSYHFEKDLFNCEDAAGLRTIS